MFRIFQFFILFILVHVSVFADTVITRPIDKPYLINGVPVPDGERPDIIRITTGSAGCTASVVGPKVVLTASHCGTTGAISTFKVNNVSYSGTFKRSSLYPAQDHDVAVIIVDKDVDLGAQKNYSTIGGKAEKGKDIQIFGYGCINPGGGGGNDGILRTGLATITDFSNFDIVSQKPGGAALCFGDSGGPAYIKDGTEWKQISVNSKGNIKDTNYTTRTDLQESTKFLEDVVAQYKVDICGVNKVCGAGPIPDKFTLENKFVKVDVVNKGGLDIEYVKRHFDMLMNFLASDKLTDIVHPITPKP